MFNGCKNQEEMYREVAPYHDSLIGMAQTKIEELLTHEEFPEVIKALLQVLPCEFSVEITGTGCTVKSTRAITSSKSDYSFATATMAFVSNF